MTSVRRMVLIPEEQLEFLKRKRNRDSDDDNDGKKRAKEDTSSLDIVEHDIIADSYSGGLSDEVIVNAMPRNYKNKARALLEHIRTGDVIRWTVKGEILSDDGDTISGSHITDLLKDLSLRDYKGDPPVGGDYFLKQIALDNIPTCLIANTTRRRQIRGLRSSSGRETREQEEAPECNWIKF